MTRTMGVLAALVIARLAGAQPVTIGLIDAQASAGAATEFAISFEGPLDTSAVGFNLIYDSAAARVFTPVLETGSETAIECSTASDLSPFVGAVGVLLPARHAIAFTVIGLNLATGPVAFGRTGVLATCRFTINADASGRIPLRCDSSADATTASDVSGNDLPASCADATLTIIDSTPNVSPTVTPTNTPRCVSSCAGDQDGDGTVTTGEATRVFLNLLNRTCNP